MGGIRQSDDFPSWPKKKDILYVRAGELNPEILQILLGQRAILNNVNIWKKSRNALSNNI